MTTTVRPLDFTLPLSDPSLPATIGKYRVQRRLGEGATSEVFLAFDDFRHQAVAIKRMRPRQQAGGSEHRYAARFFAAEAALVGRLNHPNIVRLLDAVEDPDGPYLVMEHVPGVTLRHFCDPSRLLALEQIVEVGFKCAMALGHVWRLGLIHRDVKPANVLVTLDGQDITTVKVSDFGSVLALDSDVTQVHRVGTLAYMPPEQLEGDPLDCRADLYALAAVLYHLVAGRPPFDGSTQAVLLNQVFHQPPPSLVGCRAGVSAALDACLRGALAKRRDERPANWERFAQQLSELITQGEVPRSQLQRVLDSERFTLLRGLPFFADFSDAELWEVVHRAQWRRYPVGKRLCRRGERGREFHILAQGAVDVLRDGRCVAHLGAGSSVGEMACLAPSEDLRTHQADVVAVEVCISVAFTPNSLAGLSRDTRLRFDAAFIGVLVRRLHAAHEALAHPRQIL